MMEQWEQRHGLVLLRNEWLVPQVTARTRKWGNYGFRGSPNGKIANNTTKPKFRSPCAEVEESQVAETDGIVPEESSRLETLDSPNRSEFQIGHPSWQVSQRSRRTRYCQADWH